MKKAMAGLTKVNPATGGERSMQAYWSRPLGCGEGRARKNSLVRRLTLIHWTLIRMALPGLDASVITVCVTLSSSPNITFFFHYRCSSWTVSANPGLNLFSGEKFESWSCFWQDVALLLKLYLLLTFFCFHTCKRDMCNMCVCAATWYTIKHRSDANTETAHH